MKIKLILNLSFANCTYLTFTFYKTNHTNITLSFSPKIHYHFIVSYTILENKATFTKLIHILNSTIRCVYYCIFTKLLNNPTLLFFINKFVQSHRKIATYMPICVVVVIPDHLPQVVHLIVETLCIINTKLHTKIFTTKVFNYVVLLERIRFPK